MRYYQKFMTTFPGKLGVILLTAGCLTLSCMAPGQVNFSDEWKLNESKSNHGKFPLCIFGGKVWKLINGGKSIVIQVNERSNSGEHAMTLIYDKQLAADYQF